MTMHSFGHTSGPPSSRDDEMTDLQSLLDRIQLEGNRNDQSAVDEVAENLRVRLNIRVEDEHIFHALAAQLLNVDIGKDNDPAVQSRMSSDMRKESQRPDLTAAELQTTWSTETTSTATSSSSSERRDSPTVAMEAPSSDSGNSKESIDRGRSPREGSSFTAQQSNGARVHQRASSPAFHGIFSGGEKEASSQSPANTQTQSRSNSGTNRGRSGSNLKPPMSPYPSPHNDSFGSSLPATPFTQAHPGQHQSPAAGSSRSFTESMPGQTNEPVEREPEASRPKEARGRSRSPYRFCTRSKDTPPKTRSQSVPRSVSPFRRGFSPSRFFGSSKKEEMKVDTSIDLAAGAGQSVNETQSKEVEIPKSSPLKTPLSQMTSLGSDFMTGKGKQRRKLDEPTATAAVSTAASAEVAEGVAAEATSASFGPPPVAGFSLGTKPSRERNGGRKKPSSRKVVTPVPNNASIPTEPVPSPMDTDKQFDGDATEQQQTAEFGINNITKEGSSGFSVGIVDPAQKSNRKGKGKVVRGQSKRKSDKPQNGPADTAPQTTRDQSTIAMEVGHIKTLRDNARTSFEKSDYRASISWNTKAITAYSTLAPGRLPRDCLAVLLADRAEAYLMIKAVDASVFDCKTALAHVTPAQSASPLMSTDSGPVLQARLHILFAKGLLLAGNAHGADQQYDLGIAMSEHALSVSSRYQCLEDVGKVKATLARIQADGALGKSDVSQFKQLSEKLASYNLPSLQASRPCFEERRQFVDALGTITTALLLAPCNLELHERKVALLASLRRWREVASHCERLAVVALSLEDISERDIRFRNSLKNLPGVKELSAFFFGDPNQQDFKIKDYESAEKKLNARATGEAVLRLPRTLIRNYLRSLRLEERYPAEQKAIKSLEVYIGSTAGSPQYRRLLNEFSWLTTESQKLARTKECRDRGDELFNNQDHTLAAAQYARCLKIDAEGERDGGDSGGGRLHAVLHCNRAACFMALNNFEEAVQECTAALRVHNRYMKAILRRARCHARLNRLEEAVADCERYLELVNEAKSSPNSCAAFISPCLFDGPRRVSQDDINQVQHELAENKKKLQRKENAAREEASYRGERQRFHDAYADAHRRRENWYNQQGPSGSRRWDSFNRENGTKRSPRQKNPRQPQSNAGSTRGASHVGGLNAISTEGTHYSTLQIPFGATQADIKKAYRQMALKSHPDKGGDADVFLMVNAAYQCLNSPSARRTYDESIRWSRR
ncbi:Translocation protein SEC63 homolog [Seminavis robusta]|uniref:Translocation protein SEC63 homolog n=1 Tax=Seminavis robusta TaxID=568900 RepID=A0A9N8HXP0_9STRA|nr:Translocation protein SEC63 homolog [Seminavis robusta]|eukprot:Sro2560_g331290.1 Translocation protein SEC63 homolog (1235) ;mRNA; r:7575-11450